MDLFFRWIEHLLSCIGILKNQNISFTNLIHNGYHGYQFINAYITISISLIIICDSDVQRNHFLSEAEEKTE